MDGEPNSSVHFDVERRQKLSESLQLDENGERRIEQARIHAIIDQFANFYNIPQEAVDEAKQVPVFLATDKRIRQFVEESVRPHLKATLEGEDSENYGVANLLRKAGADIDKINEAEKDAQFQQYEEELQHMGGVNLVLSDNSQRVYLSVNQWDGETYEDYLDKSKMRTLRHELIHILGHKNGTNSGFLRGPRDKRFNEASTQLLELVERAKNVHPQQLLLKIGQQSIDTSYPSEVRALLGLLTLSNMGSNPVTYQELADNYFMQGEDSDINKTMFEIRIAQSIPPEKNKEYNLLKNYFTKSPIPQNA